MDAKMQILQSFQSQLCKSLDNEQVTRVCRILDGILSEYSICKTQKTESKLDLPYSYSNTLPLNPRGLTLWYLIGCPSATYQESASK